MFKWLFKRKVKSIIVLDQRHFTKELANDIRLSTKCPVILVSNIDAIRVVEVYD